MKCYSYKTSKHFIKECKKLWWNESEWELIAIITYAVISWTECYNNTCTVYLSEKNNAEWFLKCLKKEWEDYKISEVLKKTLYMLNEKIKDTDAYKT